MVLAQVESRATLDRIGWTAKRTSRINGDAGQGEVMAAIAESGAEASVSVGRVFERAFATIRHNPAATFGLAFLFGLIPTLGTTYVMARAPLELGDGDLPGPPAAILAVMLLYWIVSVIIAVVTQAVLTRATVAESEGYKASFRECLGAALPILLPAILLAIVIGIGVTIGFVLLIVPGVIMYLIWSVATPALVEERRGVVGSLSRSRFLTKGSRWRILGILLVLLVIYWLFYAVVGLLGVISGAGSAGDELSAVTIVSTTVVGLLMNMLWGVVQASLYVELRNAKDGPATHRLEEVFA
jgi:hypothetical protein